MVCVFNQRQEHPFIIHIGLDMLGNIGLAIISIPSLDRRFGQVRTVRTADRGVPRGYAGFIRPWGMGDFSRSCARLRRTEAISVNFHTI
jgi:hypothetical protein